MEKLPIKSKNSGIVRFGGLKLGVRTIVINGTETHEIPPYYYITVKDKDVITAGETLAVISNAYIEELLTKKIGELKMENTQNKTEITETGLSGMMDLVNKLGYLRATNPVVNEAFANINIEDFNKFMVELKDNHNN